MSSVQEPLIPTATETGGPPVSSLSRYGVRIIFKDFEYLLPSNVEWFKTATVLHSMSGHFDPSEMTAIMGPSGCGKSMMMDVLARRRTRGKVNGNITYADREPSEMFIRRVTGYVEQFGQLVENLTVFEMLIYTAELKRPMSESYAIKKRAVEDLIKELALEKCRDTKIGNPQLDRGISGGQAKRVNIGIALITRPRVLFMDEPISGLDSYTSNEVMALVKSLAAGGLTLIATLHSPTPFVFNLFDKICFLLRGRMVYFGRRDRAIEYFKPVAAGQELAADSDAEWLTDVVVKADAAGKAEELAVMYDNSSIKQEVLEITSSLTAEPIAGDLEDELSITRATVTPSWFAVRTYLKYRSVKNLCDFKFWAARAPDKLLLTLLCISVYWGIGDDFSPENYTNVIAFFGCWAALSATGSSLYIPFFFEERQLFYRECHDGLYRVITYFLVRLIEELIVVCAISIATSLLSWYGIKCQGSFVIFILVYFGTFCCGLCCAFLFVSISPNVSAAVGGFSTYVSSVGLFCGFFIRVDDIPSYLVWYSKVAFLKYSNAALIMNHFESSEEGRTAIVAAGDDPSEGLTALQFYGIEGKNKTELVAYVFLFAAGYAVLAYAAMAFIRFEKR